MTIFDIFTLMGGLALFLFGMQLMGEGLEKRAGSRLKPILEQLTSKKLKGVAVGAGVTAVIQSSSATTVMIVGFVNSGLMKLSQATTVIMGANIGTTITAWLLSTTGIRSDNFWISLMKPTTFSPVLAFVGLILMFSAKRKRDIAEILLGFAILMYGMTLMSSSVSGLAGMPSFTNLLTLFSNPLFGVLIGAVVTAIIQSSSASVGILQAIANTGTLSYASALPIIMGQNIGTCITAIIASIGTNKNAKRVAAVHLSFNIIGTCVFLLLYYGANAIFNFAFADGQVTAFGIAVTHTIFNVCTTILLLPFTDQLEKLAKHLIKDDKQDEIFEMLDERLLDTPSIAIAQAHKLTAEMAQLSQNAFSHALLQLDSYDVKTSEEIYALEKRVDMYEDKIGTYLVQLSTYNLTEEDSRSASMLLHSIGDFERISDHAVNIDQSAEEINDRKLKFSRHAQNELSIISDAVTEIISKTVKAFEMKDFDFAEEIEPLEEVVDLLRSEIKASHVKRLQTGCCTIEMGFILADLLNNLERAADHCSNIAASMIEIGRLGRLDAHQYAKSLKLGSSAERFDEMYEAYLEKYRLPEKRYGPVAAEKKVPENIYTAEHSISC